MKLFAILLSLAFSQTIFAQGKLEGRYRDYFGSRIELNSNNTFRYRHNFDMMSSWTKGIWTLKGDTVYFRMIPTYDTLGILNETGILFDSLIFSIDETPERVMQTPPPPGSPQLSGGQITFAPLYTGGQNRLSYPDKLLFRKGRLYKIEDGKLITRKQRGFWTDKKWDPWYFKSDD